MDKSVIRRAVADAPHEPGPQSESDFSSLVTDVATAARRLLGCVLERRIDDQVLQARIVEVEAYDQTDPASHAVTGPSGRAAVMFGPAGRSYVYMIYGLHHGCNIVVGQTGYGAGVLVRAVEPLEGQAAMSGLRGDKTGYVVTNGPGKLCQALDIDRTLNGHDLHAPPLRLLLQPAVDPTTIVTTTRVGISKATSTPWRFYIRNNPYVSVRAKEES